MNMKRVDRRMEGVLGVLVDEVDIDRQEEENGVIRGMREIRLIKLKREKERENEKER